MSIELEDVPSGYNLSKINNNFQTIENYVNTSLLHRAETVAGEAKMNRDLDMDGRAILNLGTNTRIPTSVLTVGAGDARYYNIDGDTLTGPMNVNNQAITGLMAPVTATSPVRKIDLDNEASLREAADAITANTANTAFNTAKAIDGKVQSALDTSAEAKVTAEAIDGKAQRALDSSVAAVITANAAKATAEGIDGKAQSALDASAVAVITANSAKVTSEAINTFADNINTNYTVKDVSAINGILDVVNADGGGVGLFIPKEGVVSEDIRYRTGVWRPIGGSYGSLESYFEKIGATGEKTSRHDTYSYQWTDSNRWPNGRHVGFGRHTFNGAVEIKARHGALEILGDTGYSSYVMGKLSGVNSWHLGHGGVAKDLELYSYVHNTYLGLRSTDVYINRDLGVGGGGFRCDGSVYGPTWGGDLKTWIEANYLQGVRMGGEQRVSTNSGGDYRVPAGCVVTGIQSNAENTTVALLYRQLQIGTGAGAWRNIWDA